MPRSLQKVPPPDGELNIQAFESIFKNTHTSYKFLLALSLFSLPEKIIFSDRISLHRLAAGMLDIARKPIHLFKLHAGRDDQVGVWLQRLAHSQRWGRRALTRPTGLVFSEHHQDIPDSIVEGLTNYAAHLFLTPFFAKEIHGTSGQHRFRKIQSLARENFASDTPPIYYFLSASDIVVHPKWASYIVTNAPILKSWALWQWSRYMQKLNPNIPGIVTKLDETAIPDTTRQRKFWRQIIEIKGQLTCLYTGQNISSKKFVLDHYIPWSFIAHDNIWNLVPASQRGNAEKSDSLPSARYFDAFASRQLLAIQSLHNFPDKKKWEDIFETYSAELELDVVNHIPEETVLREALAAVINPLISIAKNRHFSPDWQFSIQ